MSKCLQNGTVIEDGSGVVSSEYPENALFLQLNNNFEEGIWSVWKWDVHFLHR